MENNIKNDNANNLLNLSYANLPNLLDLIENISFFSLSSYLINGHRNVFLFRSYIYSVVFCF